MADLSAVVARLESVTSRLESLAAGGGIGGAGEGPTSESVSVFDEVKESLFISLCEAVCVLVKCRNPAQLIHLAANPRLASQASKISFSKVCDQAIPDC